MCAAVRRIVDAHHHLWDLEVCNYPWLMAKGEKRFFGDPAPIQKNYLVEDLRSDAAPLVLSGSVHVQVGVSPGDELAESRWLNAQAQATGLPSAIVAACNLERDDLEAALDAQQQLAPVRGVRQIIGRADAEDRVTGSGRLLDDPRWRAALPLLVERSLSFDLQLTPALTQRAAEVFGDVPDLRLALCHCGSPWDQTGEGLRSWRRGLEAIAELPNAVCKLSGLGMFDHAWSAASVRPLLEACLDVFGADRCLFGSNFPVDKLHGSYAAIVAALDAVLQGAPESDKASVYEGNARRFYRF
ncbi:MAG: amidohydrolase family protein [Pseudomonadota bacterium]